MNATAYDLVLDLLNIISSNSRRSLLFVELQITPDILQENVSAQYLQSSYFDR